MTQTETTKDRLRLILGEEGLARLDRACVMVIGLGGVGSNCVEALARGGVGNLVLLDRDVADPWYTGNFDATWRDCLTGCTQLLKEIDEESR